jgi:hypothetical protein
MGGSSGFSVALSSKVGEGSEFSSSTSSFFSSMAGGLTDEEG